MMEDAEYQKGLAFANLGSQFDVSTMASSQSGGQVHRPQSEFSSQTFAKTEKSIKKQPFSTFYTANMTNEPPQQVQF